GVGVVLGVDEHVGDQGRAVVLRRGPQEPERAGEREVGGGDLQVELELGVYAFGAGVEVPAVRVDSDDYMCIERELDLQPAFQLQRQRRDAQVEGWLERAVDEVAAEADVEAGVERGRNELGVIGVGGAALEDLWIDLAGGDAGD